MSWKMSMYQTLFKSIKFESSLNNLLIHKCLIWFTEFFFMELVGPPLELFPKFYSILFSSAYLHQQQQRNQTRWKNENLETYTRLGFRQNRLFQPPSTWILIIQKNLNQDGDTNYDTRGDKVCWDLSYYHVAFDFGIHMGANMTKPILFTPQQQAFSFGPKCFKFLTEGPLFLKKGPNISSPSLVLSVAVDANL